MNKKKELKYLDQLFKKMQQQFKSFVHKPSEKALHGFRVQVKKTRSFLTLLEAHDKNDRLLKTFKPVKKLFRQTGIIRDVQVHEKQAKENHIDVQKFYKKQDALQQQETETLLHKHKKLLHEIKKVKRQLQHHIHKIPKGEIKQFFANQINNTQRLLQSHNFSEQLHDGRKMLKHLLYNQQIMPQIMVKHMHINFDDIDAIQQAIGDWHDNKLALDFFSHKVPCKDLEPMKQRQEKLKKEIIAKHNLLTQVSRSVMVR